MKSLINYIHESIEKFRSIDEELSSKNIELNFADLEEGKSAKNSLIELLDEKGLQYSESDKKVTITVTAEKIDAVKSAYDQLKGYVNLIRNSQKRSSNEQYAQKTLSFENSVKELINFIEEVQPSTPAEKSEDEKPAKDVQDKAPGKDLAKLKNKPGKSDQNKNEEDE